MISLVAGRAGFPTGHNTFATLDIRGRDEGGLVEAPYSVAMAGVRPVGREGLVAAGAVAACEYGRRRAAEDCCLLRVALVLSKRER